MPSSLSSEALLDPPDSSLPEEHGRSAAGRRRPLPLPLLLPLRLPRREAAGSPTGSQGCARHRTGTTASMRSSRAAQLSTWLGLGLGLGLGVGLG